MSDLFGTDYEGRKAIPIFEGVLMYFPKAIAAVAEVSKAGNDQHNPGQPLHWARSKSMDQFNTTLRHMMDHRMGGGRIPDRIPDHVNNGWSMEYRDKDGVRHLAKAAWRVLAALELAIEEEEAAEPKAGIRDTSQPIPADVIQRKCRCGDRVFAFRDGDLEPVVYDPYTRVQHSIVRCIENV